MLHIHSYYKSPSGIHYLEKIVLLNEAIYIYDVKCTEIKQQIPSEDSILEWNPVIKSLDSSLKQFREIENWNWINEPCRNCIYYHAIEADIYHRAKGINIEKTSQYVYDLCDLRNNIFKDGCCEMYVNCLFHKTKRDSISEDFKDIEKYEICKRLFQTQGYNNIVPKQRHIKCNSNYKTLTPKQLKLFKRLCKDNHVCGLSYGYLNWLENGCLNDDMFSWSMVPQELTIEKYYYLFMEGATDVIFAEDGSVGIGWNEMNECIIVGDKEKLDFFRDMDIAM